MQRAACLTSSTSTSSCGGRHVHAHAAAPAAQPKPHLELRVCQGRTCKRQGSPQVLKTLRDLSAGEAHLTVNDCGCLGGCGAGPNLVLLPAERLLSHVATPADAAEVLRLHCEVPVTPASLQATQLRLAGNAAAMDGELERAVQLYSEGLALDAPQGRHLLLCNRATALLQLGRADAALEDARRAVQVAPPSFANGWVRLVDCLYAVGKLEEAAEVLERAERALGPVWQGTPEHQACVHALRRRQGGGRSAAVRHR